MTNGDDGGALLEEIIRAIAKEYAWPSYLPSERQAVESDPEVFAEWVGEYELKAGLRLRVAVEAGVLLLRLTGQPAIQLYPLSETRFFARAVDVEVTFARSDPGKEGGLTFRQNQGDLFAKRVA